MPVYAGFPPRENVYAIGKFTAGCPESERSRSYEWLTERRREKASCNTRIVEEGRLEVSEKGDFWLLLA